MSSICKCSGCVSWKRKVTASKPKSFLTDAGVNAAVKDATARVRANWAKKGA